MWAALPRTRWQTSSVQNSARAITSSRVSIFCTSENTTSPMWSFLIKDWSITTTRMLHPGMTQRPITGLTGTRPPFRRRTGSTAPRNISLMNGCGWTDPRLRIPRLSTISQSLLTETISQSSIRRSTQRLNWLRTARQRFTTARSIRLTLTRCSGPATARKLTA